jgi:hypothetical protein
MWWVNNTFFTLSSTKRTRPYWLVAALEPPKKNFPPDPHTTCPPSSSSPCLLTEFYCLSLEIIESYMENTQGLAPELANRTVRRFPYCTLLHGESSSLSPSSPQLSPLKGSRQVA